MYIHEIKGQLIIGMVTPLELSEQTLVAGNLEFTLDSINADNLLPLINEVILSLENVYVFLGCS